MIEYSKDYHSFLLRMWRVKEEHGDIWRCSLENVMTGEMHGFSCLRDMQRFLVAIPEASPLSAHTSNQVSK